MQVLTRFAVSLALTLAIEVCIALAALGVRDLRRIGSVILAQFLTNPAVVLVATLSGWVPSPSAGLLAWIVMLLAETAAVIAEGALYLREDTFTQPFAASLGLNATSFVLGMVVTVIC